MAKQKGKVAQVIGPVIDVTFDLNDSSLPDIYDSLEITRENGDKLILECQQHIGEDTIRAISMESTDGISRGVEVTATGAPIKMPFGDAIKGRVFNVVGDAIDGLGNLPKEDKAGLPIHRSAPKFEDLSTSTAIGVGGDPIIGTTLLDTIKLFMDDPETDIIVLIGEIGGQLEIEAANWVKSNGNKKPVVGFIAGETAPKGRKMGHAGAIIGGKDDTASAKKSIMRDCGISVVDSPAEIGLNVQKILN